LGVWRIFGCEGGASEGTVIKAMEMAFKAGIIMPIEKLPQNSYSFSSI
jgi:hypothetical protein